MITEHPFTAFVILQLLNVKYYVLFVRNEYGYILIIAWLTLIIDIHRKRTYLDHSVDRKILSMYDYKIPGNKAILAHPSLLRGSVRICLCLIHVLKNYLIVISLFVPA